MAVSFRRQVANLIERVSGNLVIAPYDVHGLQERMHLRRLFQHYAVDCVFDVGANDGQYAGFLRQSVGYSGHVVSYEPIPELAQRLTERATATQDTMWHVENLALDQEAGPAVFHIAQSNQFSSLRPAATDQPARFAQENSMVRDVVVQRATMATELVKWQECLGFRRPFLKMDTQGNDLAVVTGAGPGLKTFVGLQTELAIRRLYEGAPEFSETLSSLSAKGFEPSAFVPNNNAHFPELYEVDCILYNRNLR